MNILSKCICPLNKHVLNKFLEGFSIKTPVDVSVFFIFLFCFQKIMRQHFYLRKFLFNVRFLLKLFLLKIKFYEPKKIA